MRNGKSQKNYEHQWKWRESRSLQTYHATDIQLVGSRSQLLNVFKSGNLLARIDTWSDISSKASTKRNIYDIHSQLSFHIWKRRLALSVKGSLPNGGSVSRYSNIGRVDGECISASSLWKPPSNRHVASREPLNRSTSVSLLPSLLVSIDSPSLSSQGCLK